LVLLRVVKVLSGIVRYCLVLLAIAPTEDKETITKTVSLNKLFKI
jgi:hypothetical protein